MFESFMIVAAFGFINVPSDNVLVPRWLDYRDSPVC